MLKKFAAVCLAVLLLSLVALSCSRSTDWRGGFVSYAAYPSVDQAGYYTIQDYSAYSGRDYERDYYYCIWYGFVNGEYISWFNYYDKSAVSFADYVDDNGKYRLNYTGSTDVHYSGSIFSSADAIVKYSGNAPNPYEINFETGALYGEGQGVWQFYGYVTNYPGVDISAGSLEFYSTPDLSGEITRSGESNGQFYTLDTFAVTCDNYSNVDYMYSWAIVPHGVDYVPYYSTPNFHDYVKSVDEKHFYNTTPTYIYFSDEWVYIPAANQTATQVLTPSSWHYIAKGGHVDNFVQFNQMQLQANTQYDLLCFGCPCRLGCTYLDDAFFPGSGYAVDFVNDVELLYTSTFSITDPAAFSRDNRGFGGYSWNRDQLYTNTDWSTKVFGYKDENGDTVIQENQMTDFNLSAHPVNGFNYSGGSRDNFDKLTDTTDNFFSAVSRVLSMFPADCLLIIKLGLAALVVVAIIKGLKA